MAEGRKQEKKGRKDGVTEGQTGNDGQKEGRERK